MTATSETSSALNPYKKDRRCPKCGSLGVTTEFCRKVWGETSIYSPSRIASCHAAGGYADHMHRVCCNCSHEFYERPADTVAAHYTKAAVERRAKKASEQQQELYQRWKESQAAMWTSPGKVEILRDPPQRRWFGTTTRADSSS
jgi:hypothetical protein